MAAECQPRGTSMLPLYWWMRRGAPCPPLCISRWCDHDAYEAPLLSPAFVSGGCWNSVPDCHPGACGRDCRHALDFLFAMAGVTHRKVPLAHAVCHRRQVRADQTQVCRKRQLPTACRPGVTAVKGMPTVRRAPRPAALSECPQFRQGAEGPACAAQALLHTPAAEPAGGDSWRRQLATTLFHRIERLPRR